MKIPFASLSATGHAVRRSHRLQAITLLALAVFWGGMVGTATGQEEAEDIVLGKWKTGPWRVRCIDPPDCAPANEIYADQLQKASQWLSSLGFRPPRMRPTPDGAGYRADVDNKANDRNTKEESIGAYGLESKMLYLNSDSFFAVASTGNIDLQVGNMYTAVHELFHGVEAAYHKDMPDSGDWIWEGMADAVLKAYVTSVEPTENAKVAARYFDDPLHLPGRSSGTENKLADYGTSMFWYSTGELLDSPDRISYLHQVLTPELVREGTGLEGIDLGFKKKWDGLYNVLPLFFTTLEGGRFFDTTLRKRAVLPSGKRESTTRIQAKVDMVAGRYVELEVQKNSGRAVEVEIRFKKDNPDLHLVVDQVRYDRADLGPRNVVRYLLVEEDKETLDVIVVNVAKKAIETKDHRSFELEVTLREVGYCSMVVSWNGDLSGATFGDVAHFSTKGGATIYGSFSNPETVGPMIESLGGFMAAHAENEKEAEAIREEVAGMRRQLEAQSAEVPREALGISLGDLKLDVEDEEAAGLAFLAGGFQLQLSVLGDGIAKDFTGPLNPDLVQVMPGPRAESTFDKVRFGWVRGMPDPPRLTITHNANGLMTGALMATLKAEGYTKKDGSIPFIRVTARFVARPGPLGCMTPF